MLENGIQRPVFRGGVGKIFSRQGNGALVRMLKARHQAQQRSLTAAGRPQQGNELAVVDLKIQTVEHRFATELLRKIAQG